MHSTHNPSIRWHPRCCSRPLAHGRSSARKPPDPRGKKSFERSEGYKPLSIDLFASIARSANYQHHRFSGRSDVFTLVQIGESTGPISRAGRAEEADNTTAHPPTYSASLCNDPVPCMWNPAYVATLVICSPTPPVVPRCPLPAACVFFFVYARYAIHV